MADNILIPYGASSSAESIIMDLQAENARLRGGATPAVGSRATVYVMTIVALCIVTIAAIIAVTIARPGVDNTALIAIMIGVACPILIALLGAAVQQVHYAVNSRLSQLLELTATASRAEGQLAQTRHPHRSE